MGGIAAGTAAAITGEDFASSCFALAGSSFDHGA